MDIPAVRQFTEALKKVVSCYDGAICLIASADLAHMGVRFGDPAAPNRLELAALAEEDRKMLGHAEKVDAESFYGHIMREKDRRRVCGVAAIYTLLRTVEAKAGRILNYGQSPDEASGSVVSFASMAFFRS